MQRYFSKEKVGNEFILSKDDYYHIERVMRMKDHDLIEVVYEEDVYRAKIKVSDEIHVMIVEKLPKQERDFLEVTLVVPLLKEQKMDYILQKATELGVSRIVPVLMERSIIKVKDREEKKIVRWRKICKEASEQSMRTTIPVVTEIKTWDDLNSLEGVKFVCSTREKRNNLKNFLYNHKNCDKIIMVVGPEGGLSEKEEEKLIEMGFEAVSLGSRIMRVETVPLFVLSILNFYNME